ASLRRHLKLKDHDGVEAISNTEIFEQLALMGYNTDSDRLTFQKGTFSPQWRFLIHTVLHCLSPKKTSWEQFSSNIATAIICLATNRKYNFSKLIFDHMVSNITSPHKFLMYPRFIQICLDMQRKQLQTHTKTYLVPSLNAKVFSNMKRATKGFTGVEVDLFPAMLHIPSPESSPAPSSSPSRITSSPTPSTDHSSEPHHTSTATPSTSEPQPTQSSPTAEDHVPIPHDTPLHAVNSHGSAEGSVQLNELANLVTKLSDRIVVLEKDLKKTKQTYGITFTKLILRVKKLETRVKTGRARRRAKIVLSEEEDPVIQDDTPTKVIEDKGSGEKGEKEVSTAEIPVSTAGVTASTANEPSGTASETPILRTAHINISTASTIRTEFRSTAGRVIYSRRSEQIREDKGKAIMTEPELVKKSKKILEQQRIGYETAVRLQEQADEERRAQIARDEEITKLWEEQERLRVESEAKVSKEIDWNDPST
ncbi:hypothetical protein Tco_1260877, partial [Tanacetum coccineum]